MEDWKFHFGEALNFKSNGERRMMYPIKLSWMSPTILVLPPPYFYPRIFHGMHITFSPSSNGLWNSTCTSTLQWLNCNLLTDIFTSAFFKWRSTRIPRTNAGKQNQLAPWPFRAMCFPPFEPWRFLLLHNLPETVATVASNDSYNS